MVYVQTLLDKFIEYLIKESITNFEFSTLLDLLKSNKSVDFINILEKILNNLNPKMDEIIKETNNDSVIEKGNIVKFCSEITQLSLPVLIRVSYYYKYLEQQKNKLLV